MPGTALPMFPLSAVLFPHASMPLHVFEQRYRELVRVCLEGDARFGIVLIERGSEVGGGDQRSNVGTRAVMTHAAALADGRWMLRVQGEARITIEEWLPDDPYPQALVTERPGPGPGADDTPTATDTAATLLSAGEQRVRRARAVLAEHGGAPALPPDEVFDPHDPDPETAAWRLCAAAPVSAYDAQRLLVAETTAARLGLLGRLMDELELDLQRLHSPP
ncbi:MAG TPA: LON peptidase substrate-binding domain-containing protein [Acidimicrobiales bacterium]